MARRALAIAVAVTLSSLTPAASAAADRTTRASVSSAGAQASAGSFASSISANGRYLAFESDATDLVSGDTNGVRDIFVRDLVVGTTTRASVDSAGAQANNHTYGPSISADGRTLAFYTAATNLVPGDTNGTFDVFVRDLVAGTTTRASVDSAGAQVVDQSQDPSISADGRYVAFESLASALAPGDTNQEHDVFVRDLEAGTTIRASISSAGVEGDWGSYDPSISADGRSVAFQSDATNLVPVDTNEDADIFLRDLVAGTTVRASVSSAGAQADFHSYDPSITGDGRYVAFQSGADNLVPGAPDPYYDMFIRDLVAGTTIRASVSSAGWPPNGNSFAPSIAADGRTLVFESSASNLVPGDTNGRRDIFVRNLAAGVTALASVDSAGAQSNGSNGDPSISADGRQVAFDSSASNLVSGDTNLSKDIFVRDRGLPPDAPALVSPPEGKVFALGEEQTFTIRATDPDGDFYTGAVTVKDATSGAVVTTFGTDSAASGQDSTGEPSPELPAGSYTWSARAIDSEGDQSPESESRGFVVVDVAAPSATPVVTDYKAEPSAFSPNGDGTKDSTSLSATLASPSGALSWRIEVRRGATVVRTFSGSGAEVAATWNGRDEVGAVALDAHYTARLSATDGAGNVRTDSIAVSLDITPPTLSAWAPADGANTLWKQPEIAVTLTDEVSGVDPDSLTLSVDGQALAASSYDSATGRFSATPTSDLSLDENHEATANVVDRAGNASSGSTTFRVVRIVPEALTAAIPDVQATVPSAGQCSSSCDVTFQGVAVEVGERSVTLSSSLHAGQGLLRRSVDLVGAVVVWESVAGGEVVTPVPLTPIEVTDGLELDEAILLPMQMNSAEDAVALPDVTVTVPVGVAPGSTAVLRMDPKTVPPPCPDSASALDPASCGGPAESSIDPLPEPYEVPDPDAPEPPEPTIPYEDYLAEEAAATVPAVRVPAAVDPALGPSDLPPSGDISRTEFALGAIKVKIKPGEDITSVVTTYGGVGADAQHTLDGPYDEVDVAVGLDRWYRITVPNGLEKTKLQDYAQDSRVEYAELESADGGDVGSHTDPDVPNDPRVSRQWNFGFSNAQKDWRGYGVEVEPAWHREDGRYFGSRRIETAFIDTNARLTHDDLDDKIVDHYDFNGWDNAADCGNFWEHGTATMGINAETDNDVAVAGLNYKGYLVAVRQGVSSSGCKFVGSQRAAWINQARKMGVEAINISYVFSEANAEECEAIKAAYLAGIVVAAGAPYENREGLYPGSKCSFTLTTTGSNTSGNVWGPAEDWAAQADVAAPAEEIVSAYQGCNTCYATFDGTSMSAPHSAGLAHLLRAMGVPVYSAFNTPRWSAGRIPECNGSGLCKGKINVNRATLSSLKNGMFELWDDDADRPTSWKRRGQCGNETLLDPTGVHYGYDGSYGVKMRCQGNNSSHEIYYNVPVTANFHHRLSVMVRRSEDSVASSSATVIMCYYLKHPNIALSEGNKRNCVSDSSDSNVLKSDGWTRWEIDHEDAVPSGDEWDWAQVILRTKTTGSGYVYWDDAGFSAIRK